MTHFSILSFTSASEIPTPSYSQRLKKMPHSGGASRIGHYKECPAPSPRVLYIQDFISNSYHWLFCNANKVL